MRFPQNISAGKRQNPAPFPAGAGRGMTSRWWVSRLEAGRLGRAGAAPRAKHRVAAGAGEPVARASRRLPDHGHSHSLLPCSSLQPRGNGRANLRLLWSRWDCNGMWDKEEYCSLTETTSAG